ncbi:transporter substrate-binding domain-containing protein [Candidatus Dependentiae bacterium]|nr:transporter substrate-binding domain-containing protein [Candidatus Dependentiae bacterium]
MQPKFLGALALLIIFSTLGYFVFRSSTAQSDDTLILGTMSGWPPYVTMSNNGSYQGFDIDIAQQIAVQLGKKLVIKDMDTASLLTALNQNKVDFVMTGLSITQERLKQVDLIAYQGEPVTSLRLVFWQTIPQGVKTLEDLKNIPNATVCVEAGSSTEGFLLTISGLTVKQLDPVPSILELKYKKALAVLIEPTAYNELKSQYPELVALTVPLNEDQAFLGCGIGVNKANTKLKKEIQLIINNLKAQGTLAALEKQWFKKEQA